MQAAELMAACPEGGPTQEDLPDVDLDSGLEDDHVRCQRLLTERWVVEDQCRWTIFEDLEDELKHHQQRSRALSCFVRAYATLLEEYDHLQEGGLGLQEAYEQMQDELREAIGDAAYWRELAEARGEEATAATDTDGAKSVVQEAPGPQALAVETADDDTVSQVAKIAEMELLSADGSEPGKSNSHDRLRSEMLKDAQSQVHRWRRLAESRGVELDELRRQDKDNAGVASESPASQTPDRSVGQRWPARTSLVAATRLNFGSPGAMQRPSYSKALSPPGLACALESNDHRNGQKTLEGCATSGPQAHVERDKPLAAVVGAVSPATNRCLVFPSAVASADTASAPPPAATAAPAHAAWGPGSAPRRCAGLGIPTRRKEVAPGGLENQQPANTDATRFGPSASPPASKAARRTFGSIGQPTRKN